MSKERAVADQFGPIPSITANDVLNRQFKRAAMGGYKTIEVDEYLEQIAATLETFAARVRALESQNREQQTRLEECHQMEETLRNALVSSQNFSADMVDSARRKADAILEDAKTKQAQAELELARATEKLSDEVLTLKAKRNRLRTDMLALLETHRQLIETVEPLPAESAAPPAPPKHPERPAIEKPAAPAPAPAPVLQLPEAPRFDPDGEADNATLPGGPLRKSWTNMLSPKKWRAKDSAHDNREL